MMSEDYSRVSLLKDVDRYIELYEYLFEPAYVDLCPLSDLLGQLEQLEERIGQSIQEGLSRWSGVIDGMKFKEPLAGFRYLNRVKVFRKLETRPELTDTVKQETA